MSVSHINGNWFAQWREEGKTKRKYFGADEVGARHYNQHRAVGTITKGESPEFAAIAWLWMASSKVRVKPKTTSVRVYQLNSHILPFFGLMPACDITHDVIDRYVEDRAKLVRNATIIKELGIVSLTLKFAVQRKYVTHNPMEGYKPLARNYQVLTPPTAEEIRAIFDHAADHVKRAILIAYYCGCRPGPVELLSIRYSQIDWAANTITIISAKKGGIPRRSVPIHPDLPLRDWYEQDGKVDSLHIIRWRGQPIQQILPSFRMARIRAGVTRKMSFYSMRHASLTAMLHAQNDIKTVADIAGSSPATILKTYAHVCSLSMLTAINSLPSLKGKGVIGKGLQAQE